MRHPADLQISGDLVTLVPYRSCHVLKYHDWMSSEEILQLTASDRLTLDEEYKMQETWAQDSDKCTFIILDKAKFQSTGSEVEAMIGDTNIFLNIPEAGDHEGEIEIMIAEESARRKGMAHEALQLMIDFGKTNLHLKSFLAKIKEDNTPSIKLFTKLGFKPLTSSANIFKEFTFILDVS